MLRFISPYFRHLNPIERLWALTHNTCHATSRQFADATFDFCATKFPKNRSDFRDSVTDNFRIVIPRNFGYGVMEC